MSFSSRSLALVVVLVFVRDAFAGCTPLWLSNRAITSVDLSSSAAMADFNSDGVMDLAISSATRVTILLTDKTVPKFAPIVAMSGISHGQLAAVDVNRDGKADLIVGDSQSPRLLVVPGNGDGTFGTAVQTSLSIVPQRLSVTDFNGDMNLDVFIMNGESGAVVIATGDGAGHFQETQGIATGTGLTRPLVGDFNGDMREDVLALQWQAPALQLFRGNGNGTVGSPSTISVPNPLHFSEAADLDGDGDLDLILEQRATMTLLMLRNDGSGAFTSAGEYTTLRPWTYEASVHDIDVADVNDDGHADVIVTVNNSIETLIGHGDGTFETPWFSTVSVQGVSGASPFRSFLSDVDGDGRADLLYAGFRYAAVVRNNCGEAVVSIRSATPLVSAGNPATAVVSVASPTLVTPAYPDPGGTVTIYEGTTALSSGSAGRYPGVSISIPGLPAGTHTLWAEYGGDERFGISRSAPFTIDVTAETTTVTLTADRDSYRFGDAVTISATTTSSNGKTPRGWYQFTVDGVPGTSESSGSLTLGGLAVGQHTVQAQYLGDAETPPSVLSAPLIIEVTRGISWITSSGGPTSPSRLGEASSYPFTFSVQAPDGDEGTVELYHGATRLFTSQLVDHRVSFVPDLSLGRHTLTAKFLGNEKYLPSETSLEHVVVPNLVAALDATAHGTTIRVAWSAPSGLTVLQRLAVGAWQDVLSSWNGSSYVQQNATPGVVYLFRLQVSDVNGNLIATSNVDAAVVASFSDDPVMPAVTRIRASHFTEIISVTNQLRAAAALTPISIPNAASGNRVTLDDIAILRGGVHNARVLLGMAAWPFTNLIAEGVLVRALDIQELRNALR